MAGAGCPGRGQRPAPKRPVPQGVPVGLVVRPPSHTVARTRDSPQGERSVKKDLVMPLHALRRHGLAGGAGG